MGIENKGKIPVAGIRVPTEGSIGYVSLVTSEIGFKEIATHYPEDLVIYVPPEYSIPKRVLYATTPDIETLGAFDISDKLMAEIVIRGFTGGLSFLPIINEEITYESIRGA